jgi:hydroxyacylglutathione hydrolase
MKVQALSVGEFESNCYLYWDESTLRGVVIDPGDDAPRILRAIEHAGFQPEAILVTHGHCDHIGAIASVKAKYDVPVMIGRGEEPMLTSAVLNLSSAIGIPVTAPPADRLLDDEELVVFSSFSFRILLTPGHSPAEICFLDEREGRLFCGDVLFYGSIGRSDFPGSSHDVLIRSIETKILTLPDGIVCYPGHGPQTTVGAERVNNPFLNGSNFA